MKQSNVVNYIFTSFEAKIQQHRKQTKKAIVNVMSKRKIWPELWA